MKTKKRPASKRKNFYNGLDGPTPMSMWPHSLGIKAITSSWEGAVDDRRVRGAQVWLTHSAYMCENPKE